MGEGVRGSEKNRRFFSLHPRLSPIVFLVEPRMFTRSQSPIFSWDRWDIARITRGGSRIFFRRGYTRLLLYFNTNKPHSFFFCRIPVVLENRRSSHGGGGGGGGPPPPPPTPCTLPLDPPLLLTCRCCILSEWNIFWVFSCSTGEKMCLVGLIDQLFLTRWHIIFQVWLPFLHKFHAWKFVYPSLMKNLSTMQQRWSSCNFKSTSQIKREKRQCF